MFYSIYKFALQSRVTLNCITEFLIINTVISDLFSRGQMYLIFNHQFNGHIKMETKGAVGHNSELYTNVNISNLYFHTFLCLLL